MTTSTATRLFDNVIEFPSITQERGKSNEWYGKVLLNPSGYGILEYIMKRGVKPMKKVCKTCGQEKDILAFEKFSETRHRNTCRQCRQKGKGPLVTFTCPVCNQPFEKPESYLLEIQGRGYQGTYCSRLCARRRNIKVTESDYPAIVAEYQSGRTAESIAKDYDVTPTIITKALKKSGITLLQSVDYIKLGKRPHPTLGKGHSKKAIEKIRQATIKQFSTQEARDQAASKQSKAIADGKFAVVSQVEKTVEAILQVLNVPYFPQSLIRDPQTKRFCGCVDFELLNKVVIEVNGTYWHSDPRFYPDGPVHRTQINVAQAYERKMKSLKRLGYQVVEIWEHDINQDAMQAVIDALHKAVVKPVNLSLWEGV